MPIRSSFGGSRLLGKSVSVVTGGTLSSDSNYYYRTFTSNGTLTISGAPLVCSYIIVGAGGAGAYGGGGGGGGGFRAFSSTLAPNSYNAVIGAGGNSYSNGGNTTFNSLSATGGGVGGGGSGNINGGSGGGAKAPKISSKVNAGTGNAGGYTPAEGYNGGDSGVNYGDGGGGGAGAAGYAGQNFGPGGLGGTGGNSRTDYESWGIATNTGRYGTVASNSYGWYGGGGGGGTQLFSTSSFGFNGGDGGWAKSDGTNNDFFKTGSSDFLFSDAYPASGGGGGGGGWNNYYPDNPEGTSYISGRGGGGLVIVRYLKSAV